MKPGSLIVAYLHGGEVAHSFHHSCRNLWTHDLLNHQRLKGFVAQECGAGRITEGRNDAVRKFLTHDAEWLAFVDSDMGFDPDTFDRLIDAADPVERPIVGALAFGQRRAGFTDHGAVRLEQYPTIYRWVDGAGVSGCASMYDYPADTLVECDATGAACFIVHRTVLERMAATFPAPRQWFDEMFHKGRFFGEDLTFFLRCKELGYRTHVHTGVKTSHYKHVYLSEDTQPSLDDIPTYVVIPMKDRMDLTRPLLEQLAEQGGYERILLYDNGSSEQTKAELATVDIPHLTVADAAGWNIHQMWNAGIDEAVRLSRPCNIAILNNDLKIGPRFLSGLASALRRDPLLAAVCPNYDGRPGDGVQYVNEICADRYDGTGGLAGFAFMITEESNYRFPDELHWWYGDNHMLASIAYAGSKAGIVLGTTVEHVDGGKQTGAWDDPKMAAVIEQDRNWFENWIRQVGNGGRESPYRHARAGAEGSAVRDGVAYHDIPGYAGDAERSGTRERAIQILTAVDVAGKRGLDIGCGPGGISIELARVGAEMIGVDHDPSALAVGEEVAAAENLKVTFTVGDVVDKVPDLLQVENFDFAVWLSQYMWAVKQHGDDNAEALLSLVAESVPTLVFETAQGEGDGMAGDWAPDGPQAVRELLERHYPSVMDMGPSPGRWEGGRNVFLCRHSVTISGIVSTGFAAAARDVSNGWYADALPYKPFPGTLNIKAAPALLPNPDQRLATPDGRDLLLWEARVGDVDCHLMFGGDDPSVVELLAPVSLRDALSVDDGDQVTVEVGRGG